MTRYAKKMLPKGVNQARRGIAEFAILDYRLYAACMFILPKYIADTSLQKVLWILWTGITMGSMINIRVI